MIIKNGKLITWEPDNQILADSQLLIQDGMIKDIVSSFDGQIWILQADTWMKDRQDRIRLAGEVVIFGN